MALKVKIKTPAGKGSLSSLLLRAVLICVAAFVIVGSLVGGFFYLRYGRIVDERLQHPIFANTAKIYAAPREVRPGQRLPISLITNELREAGYTVSGVQPASQLGTYLESDGAVSVYPGPQSYHAPDSATIHVSSGVVTSITDNRGQQLASYELEPLLITGLSDDANRTKRRLITYNEIPPNLVQAVLAIEDRRFFEHGGVNYTSMIGWAWHDMIGDRKHRGGASTITMQLAKMLFVADNRTISYKVKQILVTFHLEHRFTKQQIFETYANQVPLGQRGSFSINGFGEAAEAYFGKDVRQLDLAQCAMLAGMIQRPNYFNPWRHAERMMARRNLVLDSMVETGAITKDEAEQAKDEPLQLAKLYSVDASEAPYFVDLVHEQLLDKLGDRGANLDGLRIYTTLDPDLQRIATAAVENTIHVVDAQVDRVHARDRKLGKPYVYPQVALVALNPHTGQVLALVGGRSYGASQLDHAMAYRPTGSIFKPLVYAAAFRTAVEGTMLPGQNQLFSPVTMLNDAQTTYDVGGQSYTPHNFIGESYGEMTARFALMRSDNIATIGLASMVGFDRVAELARDAGVKSARATPAMAIGAYSATPLDMAGVYTVFANNGLHIDPWMLASVRTTSGDVIQDFSPTSRQVLDPRVAFLTTSMMEDVLRGQGTGADVRNMGFLAPAAGKTGTDHDAWFAGFTSNLLCIVWVGNDDYTALDPENRGRVQGSRAAGPIWAEFMKNAVKLPQYSDTNDFTPPPGVQIVSLDRNTNLLADTTCPDDYTAAFLDGTAPTNTCDHPPDNRNIFQKIFGLGQPKPALQPQPR